MVVNKNPMLFITIYHFPGLVEAISHASHHNNWLENHLICVAPSTFLNLYYNPKDKNKQKQTISTLLAI